VPSNLRLESREVLGKNANRLYHDLHQIGEVGAVVEQGGGKVSCIK